MVFLKIVESKNIVEIHSTKKTEIIRENYEGTLWYHCSKINFIRAVQPKIVSFENYTLEELLFLKKERILIYEVLSRAIYGDDRQLNLAAIETINYDEVNSLEYQLELNDLILCQQLNSSKLYIDKEKLMSSISKMDRGTFKRAMKYLSCSNKNYISAKYSIDRKTGRIFCSTSEFFNPIQVNSPEIQSAIVPKQKENKLAVLDYSKFDLTTILEICGIKTDIDFYKFTADHFDVSRDLAKEILYNLIYSNERKKTTWCSDEDWLKYCNEIDAKLISKINVVKEELLKQLYSCGYMTTPLGRKISLNLIESNLTYPEGGFSDEAKKKNEIKRIAFIYYIFNCSSDIFKTVLLEIFKEKNVEVLTQRFDSIFIEFSKKNHLQDTINIMENPITSIPFCQYKINYKVGNNFYELTRK